MKGEKGRLSEKGFRHKGLWNEGATTTELSSGELEQMRNFISYKAACRTSALHFLITAFNKDVSFLTDRETKSEVYNADTKHLSPTLARFYTNTSFLLYTTTTSSAKALAHDCNTSTLRSRQRHKWEHMSICRVCQWCEGQLFGWGII